MKKDEAALVNVSIHLKGAILKSLEEEKAPRSSIFIKAVGIASVLAVLCFVLLRFVWGEDLLNENIMVSCSLWILLTIGLSLYFFPQPRLIIRGYWSSWILAKALIGMSLVTVLQLTICPEFAQLNFHSPFPVFTRLTNLYMSFGGMRSCMFLCGLTFSFLGAMIVFFVIRKVFPYSRTSSLVAAIGISALGQTPVIALQLFNSHSRGYFPFWLFGSILGLATVAFTFKLARQKQAESTSVS